MYIKETLWLKKQCFYQGIIIAGFGFIGQTWLLKNYLPSKVTIISLSQPVFGVFLAQKLAKKPLTIIGDGNQSMNIRVLMTQMNWCLMSN